MDRHAPPFADADQATAFEIKRGSTDLPTNLIFASPHSGRFYPQDMGCAVDVETLRQVEDAAMDQLIASGAHSGATLLLAHYGRAYVDLNRAEADLDPVLITDCTVQNPTPKTVAGYGVLHRLSAGQQPLYQHRLTMAEAESRLSRVYRPYHEALSELMQQGRARHGQSLLVDWHSMPERATGPQGPDIILGDRHGTSCDVTYTRMIRQLFETQGLKVGLNRPYAGGHATQIWGRPDEGFHALQIEVNRRLYWDEARHQPSIGWKRCQSLLKRVIAELGRQYSAGQTP